MWTRTAVAALAVAAIVGTTAWFTSSERVTGTVRCTSGARVSGVWVEGKMLGHVSSVAVNSGFATVRWNGPDIFTSTFEWNGHLWGGQRFHVGCGEDGNQWRVVAYSPVTRASNVKITCDDQPVLDRQARDAACIVENAKEGYI